MKIVGYKGPFYRRALPSDIPGALRFGVQVVGKNTLQKTMKRICDAAGFVGYFTNHSGKVTCASQLYDAGIDEQLIMSRTGHRSTDGVRSYKRPSNLLEYEVSETLDPPPAHKPKLEAFCDQDFAQLGSASQMQEKKSETLQRVFGNGCSFTKCSINF